MTLYNAIGWVLCGAPLLAMAGVVMYAIGWTGVAAIVGALGITAMIVIGVHMATD